MADQPSSTLPSGKTPKGVTKKKYQAMKASKRYIGTDNRANGKENVNN